MVRVLLPPRLKVPDSLTWHQLNDASDGPCTPSITGICSFQLHVKGTKIIWHKAESESAWLCLFPSKIVPGFYYCWRKKRDSGLGDRLHRSLGHSPEQNLLLSSESHGHQHLPEVFGRRIHWSICAHTYLWLVFRSTCSCSYQALCSGVLLCPRLL